jgi:hypothetical protein
MHRESALAFTSRWPYQWRKKFSEQTLGQQISDTKTYLMTLNHRMTLKKFCSKG